VPPSEDRLLTDLAGGVYGVMDIMIAYLFDSSDCDTTLMKTMFGVKTLVSCELSVQFFMGFQIVGGGSFR
jgi:hypothetical protein